MAGGSEKPGYAVDPDAASIRSSMDIDEPTEEEKHTLRRVSDKLPWSAFLVAIVELCERFAYYGLSGPFQNYMSNSWHDSNGLPGAIGLAQHGATGLSNFFQFWCYVTPIIGAIVADQFLGKYLTIVYFSLIYMLGILILFLTSLPVAIEHGAALGGLITAMVVIGLGTGGIKSNVSPLIAEQYRAVKPFIRTLSGGERVIVDPAVTIQRIYMIFYLCINVGSLSSIATTELEKNIGFWSAYLLPFLMFIVGFCVLVAGKKKYIVRPPKGSVITNCFRALWIGLMNKGHLDAAKPSYQEEYGRRYNIPWNDLFIEELKRALVACKVFLFFPIYWVTYNQMLNNFISQAGQMQLHGIPNDIMQNIDPITIIIFIPIMDRLVYPLLRRIGIPFRPITRIFWGFLLGSLAMAYAAIVQHLIYTAGPCYTAPGNCDAGLEPDGNYAPNNVHVAVQTPAYLLIGLSEIFASITGLEYAFTKAPPSMKSFIMSMFLLTSAFGSALGAALSPTAVDPKLMWMYIGLAVACLVAGLIFWAIFSRYNKTEESMNELEAYGERARPVEEVSRALGGAGTEQRGNDAGDPNRSTRAERAV
ncbi:di/tri peptide transporter 2 [Lepidopterella palustris CBS 459.81]|uniref:Di/tri peptide transporter 2 n=1 Tax=Lepidopterella palustris CBS 459.81 TaxID=1314670 RepID=A0A8E2EH41_9PEZI|nr:di/tri peptide transporter 2 [Lepidopterella palustris CBS 459.81]